MNPIPFKLTPRDTEILSLIMDGYSPRWGINDNMQEPNTTEETKHSAASAEPEDGTTFKNGLKRANPAKSFRASAKGT